MLIGLFSFLSVGIIIGLLTSKSYEGALPILGVPLGSLLMLFWLGKLGNGKVSSVIIRSELGAIAGFLAGFMIGELLGWVIGLIFPSLGDMNQFKSQIIPNLITLIIADAIFGAFLGDFCYGRKSIGYFTLVCGIASLPFGILLSIPIKITWINFDQNLLFILTSLGTTTGLSIGLYSLLKLKK